MTLRLQQIVIRNFKAFREFTLDLEGRHLLVYGANGSGKSSLYWALYTFLQSARKPTPGVAKYFNPGGDQSLLNIYEQHEAAPRPGEIALTFRDAATRADTVYRISHTAHDTRQQPVILKGDLASDFVTYRFFFGFSHFRNSQNFDLWPLFEQEILPFCVSTGGRVPFEMWTQIRGGNANPLNYTGRAGKNAYLQFQAKTNEFAAVLSGVIDSISDEAQRFYDEHFAADDASPITLKLAVTSSPRYDFDRRMLRLPELGFGIQVGGRNVSRPQVFLNEAKLTQLALSVRFAASRVNLHESDLKLLVLDDLLVSLDMSNRMKVVEILLSGSFANYQKIILTHELGFFREFRRKVGAHHAEWSFLSLDGTPNTRIEGKIEKTDIQKAEDYLHGRNLEEAALYLRKCTEDLGRRWREWMEGRALPPGTFFTLTENLRAAKNQLLNELPMNILEEIVERTPQAVRELLVASTDDDVDQRTDFDAATKGILKSKRRRLRQVFTADHSERLRRIRLIDDLLACTERVLNPAAHAGSPPLYELEVQNAIDLVRQLKAIV